MRHLDYAPDTPIHELGAAALDEILDRGDLDAWAPLARAIQSDPRGDVADTVLRLCEAHPMYGTSALWRAWIERLRAAESLAVVRKRRGLTQQDMSSAMGISQSDVSKLERRKDMRVSTLRAYVAAAGGRLELVARFPDGTFAVID